MQSHMGRCAQKAGMHSMSNSVNILRMKRKALEVSAERKNTQVKRMKIWHDNQLGNEMYHRLEGRR